MHDPSEIPEDWEKNGWAIHGHIHNKGRFIDIERKRINVSVEQINYTPVNIDAIVNFIEESKLS